MAIAEAYRKVIIEGHFPEVSDAFKSRMVGAGVRCEGADRFEDGQLSDVVGEAVQNPFMAFFGYRALDATGLREPVDVLDPKFVGFEALGRGVFGEQIVGARDMFGALNGNLQVRRRVGLSILRQAGELTKHINEVREAQGLAAVTMSLNLDPGFLGTVESVDEIKRVIKDVGIGAHQVVAEILETVNLAENPVALEVVNGLHQAGVQIAVDDLGEGYSVSNLQALCDADLVIEEVKFSGEFSREIGERWEDVRRLINMSAVLGVTRVIFEGHYRGVNVAAIRERVEELNLPGGVFFEGIENGPTG